MSDLSTSQPSVSGVVLTPAVSDVAAASTTDAAAVVASDDISTDTDSDVVTTASTGDAVSTADTASENAPAVTTTDTDKLKSALVAAGQDVEGYWDVVVAFGEKADADIIVGIKKALTYLESEAVKVFDEALALANLKK